MEKWFCCSWQAWWKNRTVKQEESKTYRRVPDSTPIQSASSFPSFGPAKVTISTEPLWKLMESEESTFSSPRFTYEAEDILCSIEQPFLSIKHNSTAAFRSLKQEPKSLLVCSSTTYSASDSSTSKEEKIFSESCLLNVFGLVADRRRKGFAKSWKSEAKFKIYEKRIIPHVCKFVMEDEK